MKSKQDQRGGRGRKSARCIRRAAWTHHEPLECRVLLSTLSGSVWRDLDADGARGPGEPGHAGVMVYLDHNRNGRLDAGEMTQVTRADEPGTPGDETGAYAFTGLTTGFYAVAEVVPEGWVQSAPRPPESGPIELVSRSASVGQADVGSNNPSISADGRFVAFSSFGDNLVPNDTNGVKDVFVFDRQTRTVERISVSSTGAQGGGDSDQPSISADGRYVAFGSIAPNLVPGDTNGAVDVFVFDRQTRSIERISVTSAGWQAYGHSTRPSISADGRYVAYESEAANLVAADWNYARDIFLFDRQTRRVERVSVSSAGTQGDDISGWPRISADGAYVAYQSTAGNLVPGDTNGVQDIFVFNRQTRTVERVSVSSAGEQASGQSDALSISADGRYVAFDSEAGNLVPGDTNYPWSPSDVFVFDRETRMIERVSVNWAGMQANSDSKRPSISADGRYLAFLSSAGDLAPGPSTAMDAYVFDRRTRTIQRLSVGLGGSQAEGQSGEPSISADGRYVAFESMATNLILGQAHGEMNLEIVVASNGLAPAGSSQGVVVCADRDVSGIDLGNYLPGEIRGAVVLDDNGSGLPDAGDSGLSGVTVYLDRNGNGRQDAGEPAGLSGPNGSYTFSGLAPGNYQVRTIEPAGYEQGWPAGPLPRPVERVSLASSGAQSNGASYETALSADGRYVAFDSIASNLVPGDTNGAWDIFVFDLQTRTIERVSVSSTGAQALGDSSRPAISADGRYVAFQSLAGNLVAGDTNGYADIFVFDRQTRLIERVSVNSKGEQAPWESERPAISADGRYVAFESTSPTLVPGDTNVTPDIFVFDRQTRLIECVNVNSAGRRGDRFSYEASISEDGRYVAFRSDSSNLVPGDTNGIHDIFVFDRQTRQIERVSLDSWGQQADAASWIVSLSADGRYVAFDSDAGNLVPDDTNGATDTFVFDRQTRTIERVSVDGAGMQANGPSYWPSLSADGRYVSFASEADNLVSGDTNGTWDVFVFDRQTRTVKRVNVDSHGAQADRTSRSLPAISADGRYVALTSVASNLVAGDTNNTEDIFVVPSGRAPVADGREVSLAMGQVAGGFDFAFQKISRIADRVWDDRNANGLAEPQEAGLESIAVRFYQDDGDGRFESDGDDAYRGMRMTAEGGWLAYEGIDPGTYWMQIDENSARLRGYKASRSNAVLVSVADRQHVLNQSFGYFDPITVSTLSDELDADREAGDLSLREALQLAAAAPGYDVIDFAPGLVGAIRLEAALGQLTLDSNVVLQFLGAQFLTIEGAGNGRVMYISFDVEASLSGLAISGGATHMGAGLYAAEGSVVRLERMVIDSNTATQKGGGIYAGPETNLLIADTTISNNTAGDSGGGIYSDGAVCLDRSALLSNAAQSTLDRRGRGGGLYAGGQLTIRNSTVGRNIASFHGGGLYLDTSASVLTNVTIAENRSDSDANASGQGGGIYNDGSATSLLIHNTIVAANVSSGANLPDDITGATSSDSSHNLIGTPVTPLDVRLMPLANYGGPTPTYALRIDSPAIDAGNNFFAAAATDQRAVERILDHHREGAATVDIGAYEARPIFTVTGTKDESTDTDGLLSLREALALAEQQPGLDVIRFSTALLPPGSELHVELPASPLAIVSQVDIQGPDSARLLIDAPQGLLFSYGVSATLSDLTIRSSSASAIQNAGTLTLHNVLITDSRSLSHGGAIYNSGDLTLINTTLSANAAATTGGAIHNAAGTILAVNVTIYDNHASSAAGGIYVAGGTVTLHNTIVAGNTLAGGTSVDVAGNFDPSSSFNFVGLIDGSTGLRGPGTRYGENAQPRESGLQPLSDNGGPTLTHGLKAAAPVTDAGSDTIALNAGLNLDQRHLPRIMGGTYAGQPRIDIGAFEQQFPINLAPQISLVRDLRGAAEARDFTIRHDYLLGSSDAADPELSPIAFRIEQVYSGTLTLDAAPIFPGQTVLNEAQGLSWRPPTDLQFDADGKARLKAFSVRARDERGIVSQNSADVFIEVRSAGKPVNYAVLFSGGDSPSENYPHYYANIERLYRTLIDRYVEPYNIYIVYADGRDPAPDMAGNINSDMTFGLTPDQAPVHVRPGTQQNLRSTLTDLSRAIDGNDHLFFWTFDHGMGLANRPAVSGEEILRGWKPDPNVTDPELADQDITDQELRVWLQGLRTGDEPAAYQVDPDYAGISAGYTTYLFGQCFAGGMLDNLALAPDIFGAAASNHYEVSWGDYFVGAFTDALTLGYNATQAAFQYAFQNDFRARDGGRNGGAWSASFEHPWSDGGDFPIFAMERANAPLELKDVRPLKIPLDQYSIEITYDMMMAAADAQDPLGQALTFRIVSEDIGQLWRDGRPINLSSPADTTLSFGQSVTWNRTTSDTSGILNAFRITLVGSDGNPAGAARPVPIRLGPPTSGLRAVDDSLQVQRNSSDRIIDVLSNDTGVGRGIIDIGVASHGQVTLDLDSGQVRYTPARDYLGDDTFSYLISDGINTDIALAIVRVVAYDPDAAALADIRFDATELTPPPRWAGLPESWSWAYRQTMPAWTSTEALAMSDDGFIAVGISRPDDWTPTPSGGFQDFYYAGSTNAGYRWPAGKETPYWNISEDGSVSASNVLMTMLDADLEYVSADATKRRILHGLAPRSLRNPGITPMLRYWDPTNATDPVGRRSGGVLFDLGTDYELWLDAPQDIFPLEFGGILSNDTTYLAAANYESALGTAPTRAQLWQFTRTATVSLQELPGWAGHRRSHAVAMDDAARVIGWAEYQLDDYHAFYYDGTTMIDLGALPGHAESQATAINAAGQIVGFSSNDHSLHAGSQGFLWNDGVMTPLGTLTGPAGWSIPHDINNSGVIVGASNGMAVIWINGIIQNLNSLVTLPSGVTLTAANAINNNGQIAANATLTDGSTRAYYLELRTMLAAVDDSLAATNRAATASFNVLENDTGVASVMAVDTSKLKGKLTWDAKGNMSYDAAGSFDNLGIGQAAQTSFTYTVSDGRGARDTATVTIAITGAAALSTFHVLDFQPTDIGFNAQLSDDLNLALLNLYDSQDASFGQPDASLIGQTQGRIPGSLFWDPATRTLSFIATGGPLAPDTYTATLAGRADGIVSDIGAPLDGDANNAPGGDYAKQFTVLPSAARVVSLPDFARGPGQPLNVPATQAGLPIAIDQAKDIRSAQFTLSFDPSLLNVQAVDLAGDMPDDWRVDHHIIQPGQISIGLFGVLPLPDGARDLVLLTASVPNDAVYGSSGLLRLGNVMLNEGAVAGRTDDAVHLAAFLGDATGDGSHSGLDAAHTNRVVVGSDSGLKAYRLTDPLIALDVTANGSLTADDASHIAAKAAGFPQNAIPDVPSPRPPVPGAPARTVSIPLSATLPANSSLILPVRIDDAAGLKAIELTFTYDTNVLDILGPEISRGALTQEWTLVKRIDDERGTLKVILYGNLPLSSGAGTLLHLGLRTAPGAAPGAISPLRIDTTSASTSSLNEGQVGLNGPAGGVTIAGPAAGPETILVGTTVDDAVSVDGMILYLNSAPVLSAPAFFQLGPLRGSTEIELKSLMIRGLGELALVSGGGALRVGTLTVLGGTLDLTDNDLILSSGDLTAIESLIRSARNDGKWDGPGLTTSSATPYTGLSVSPSGAQIKIKYSYNGDANQDGVVNALDYFQIDSGFLAGSKGYGNGDFNLDGVVNALDYFLIDSAFLGQSSPLSRSIAASAPSIWTRSQRLERTAFSKKRIVQRPRKVRVLRSRTW